MLQCDIRGVTGSGLQRSSLLPLTFMYVNLHVPHQWELMYDPTALMADLGQCDSFVCPEVTSHFSVVS